LIILLIKWFLILMLFLLPVVLFRFENESASFFHKSVLFVKNKYRKKVRNGEG